MKLMKNVKASILFLGLTGLFVACSDDDPVVDNNPKGRLAIAAHATYTPTGERTNVHSSANVLLSKFLVNISEIELGFDDVIDNDNIYNSDDEIELKGPFEMDLLANAPVPLLNIYVPNGRLEEIEFEFDRSPNPQSELHNKSMLMQGTIDGTPFVFWHDFEEEIGIEFDEDDPNTVISNDQNGIVINFDLNQVFNTATVDLSTAIDGNGDGIIEISPSDSDGNRPLAEAMKRAIKAQIKILEDLND